MHTYTQIMYTHKSIRVEWPLKWNNIAMLISKIDALFSCYMCNLVACPSHINVRIRLYKIGYCLKDKRIQMSKSSETMNKRMYTHKNLLIWNWTLYCWKCSFFLTFMIHTYFSFVCSSAWLKGINGNLILGRERQSKMFHALDAFLNF